MATHKPTFVIGDIHGYFDTLVDLLRAAGLIDTRMRWSGQDAALWFMGDFFDRGPDGIAAVDLIMQLQCEAAAHAGSVHALLGNHEPVFLASHFFGEHPTTWGETFTAHWLRNGGQPNDLALLTDKHIEWLIALPAMAHVRGRLFVHADSLFYTRYGSHVEEVNRNISSALHTRDIAAWDRLITDFATGRFAFFTRGGHPDDPANVAGATAFLDQFCGSSIVHGHTVIGDMLRKPDSEVTEALVYANGLCVNVDGGICDGGPGFVYKLSQL